MTLIIKTMHRLYEIHREELKGLPAAKRSDILSVLLVKYTREHPEEGRKIAAELNKMKKQAMNRQKKNKEGKGIIQSFD